MEKDYYFEASSRFLLWSRGFSRWPRPQRCSSWLCPCERGLNDSWGAAGYNWHPRRETGVSERLSHPQHRQHEQARKSNPVSTSFFVSRNKLLLVTLLHLRLAFWLFSRLKSDLMKPPVVIVMKHFFLLWVSYRNTGLIP